MFQFPRFPSSNLWIQLEDDAGDLRPGAGFPHSEIPGSRPAHGSPRLIAVFHVLLRHLAPRHPPYALSSLTIRDAEKLTFFTPAFCSLAESWLQHYSVVNVREVEPLSNLWVDFPETLPTFPVGGGSRSSTPLYAIRPGTWPGRSSMCLWSCLFSSQFCLCSANAFLRLSLRWR
jgi:hypothetical protein